MAVIGEHDVAVPHCRGAQAVVEPDVIPEGKGGRVHFLGLQIGRVRIDHRTGPGVLPNHVAAVLVLHHHTLQSVRGMAEQAEEAAQLHAPAAEGLAGGAVAVPDAQVVGCGPLYVRQAGPAHQELLDLLPVHGREVVLRNLELLLQVVLEVILMVEEAEHQLEVRPGV